MHEELFLSSWLRETVEGKAEEREKLNKGATERERKRVAVVCKRSWCEVFSSSMDERACEKDLVGEVVDLSVNEIEHWCEVSVCVLVSVFLVSDLFSLVNVVCDVDFSVSDCEIEQQTFSLSSKRDVGVALECEQYKNTKAGMEAAPFQSVPKRTPVKAVPECLRNRAPPPPKGTLLKQKTTWSGPLSDLMPEAGETPRRASAVFLALERPQVVLCHASVLHDINLYVYFSFSLVILHCPPSTCCRKTKNTAQRPPSTVQRNLTWSSMPSTPACHYQRDGRPPVCCRRPGHECARPRGAQKVCVRQDKGRTSGGGRKVVCDHA